MVKKSYYKEIEAKANYYEYKAYIWKSVAIAFLIGLMVISLIQTQQLQSINLLLKYANQRADMWEGLEKSMFNLEQTMFNGWMDCLAVPPSPKGEGIPA